MASEQEPRRPSNQWRATDLAKLDLFTYPV